MVDENSIEYKYGAECFKVVRLEREVAALKAELAQQTHNSAMDEIAFLESLLNIGCPNSDLIAKAIYSRLAQLRQ
jgi:hypothetical protein